MVRLTFHLNNVWLTGEAGAAFKDTVRHKVERKMTVSAGKCGKKDDCYDY